MHTVTIISGENVII